MHQQIITAVGIDFGGTSVKLGVCRGGELLESIPAFPTANYQGPEALIEAMAQRIDALRQKYPEIAAIGVGVPGLVDFDRGYVHILTNVPGWNGVHLRDILSKRCELPVVVENDANAMCYAEWRYGAAQGLRNVVALTLGTGVGGGLILNDRLHRGSQFSAGEIGQMSIDYRGISGHYGNLGALEKYMGNNQIASYAQGQYAEAGIQKSVDDCSPKSLSQAAEAGDQIAIKIWKDIADWLGTSLSSIAWLLNPDAFIIGGGVALAGEVLFSPLSDRVHSMLSSVAGDHLKILPAKFHNDAGIIGNAALAADSLSKP